MSNIARVYTPANIFQGPADIYINLTAPTSSLVPTSDANTLTLDASGQPTSSTGFHAGLVDAPTMPTITEKMNEISADQIETPIDVALDSIEAEIDFVLKETNLSRFQALLTSNNLGAYNAITGQQALQIGGQPDASVSFVTVCAIAVNRANTAKFAYWFLYKATLASPVQFTFHRSKENLFKVKAKGVADLTRVLGDELMQIVKTR